MRVDLNVLKTELSRLTDMKYLKKELNRIASEVKKFDVHRHLNPQARERLETLEERFHDALKNLQALQKQVDANLERILKTVRSLRKGSATGRTKKKRTAKKTTRKATPKRASNSKKKASRA